jgi:hypothetical protein
MKMFELRVTSQPSHIGDEEFIIETIFFINNEQRYTIREQIPKGICKHRELFERMIDKQFYEMKRQVKTYLAIKENL